jgi:formate-dependent nitrite reductase cytochrome c552 subunit
MLSKNAASSRAIPTAKMRQHIVDVPQAPVHWGKNQPGMQAYEELDPVHKESAQLLWVEARNVALNFSVVMEQIGAHKQIVNRITEPYMQMKVVCSGTEFANLFYLRDHEHADPTIRELARVMRQAYDASTPWALASGEWHVPYVDRVLDKDGELHYFSSGNKLSLEDAIKVSASCCAQVSYRNLDESLEKAISIYDRLINSKPMHASPVEHQGVPIDMEYTCAFEPETWENGITHVRKDGSLWSANFKGFVQYRQLLEGHTVW